MNDTIADNGIDLDRYVHEVRRSLADLPEDARDELTDGLTADLAELVAERGPGALPRPDEYAAELRAAAGLPPATRRPLLAPDWWRPAWDLAVAVLPAWWVARAWIWVMALHLFMWGSASDTYDVVLLPTSSAGAGFALWVVATVLSVQIGRGRLWPGGSDRSTAAVVALVVLNVASLVGAVWVTERTMTTADQRAFEVVERSQPTNPAVVTYQKQQSCSLLVFDAHDRRLRDVKIQDQTGRVLPQHNRDC